MCILMGFDLQLSGLFSYSHKILVSDLVCIDAFLMNDVTVGYEFVLGISEQMLRRSFTFGNWNPITSDNKRLATDKSGLAGSYLK